jgi:hypothetical protein
MVCGHSIRFRSNTCGQIHVAEPSRKTLIGGADPRHQSRAEWIGITEIKIEKGVILSHNDEVHCYWSTTLTTVCGGELNTAVVDNWMVLLESTIKEYSIDEDCIFSMNETCCFLDRNTMKTRHIGSAKQLHQLALCNEVHDTATLIPIISGQICLMQGMGNFSHMTNKNAENSQSSSV